MFTIIVFTSLLVLILLFPLVAYSLSTRDIFFTQVESGNIKFILSGESFSRIIHDVNGKELDSNNMLVDGNEYKTFLNKRGIWWIGFPPFSSIHTFQIKKEKENVSGKTPEEWITHGEETSVSSLRGSFPRPFVFRDVELMDRTTIDLLVTCKFEVVDPLKLVFVFKGDFFDNTGSILGSKVDDMIKDFNNLAAFIAEKKNEHDGFLHILKENTNEFNKVLVEQIGLRLVGISVSKFDPSDKEVLKASNAEAIALLQAKGIRATFEINAEKTRAEGAATRDSLIETAKGKEAQIQALVNQMKSTGASNDTIAKAITDVLKAEALTGPNSKITTLVDGNSANLILPTGGQK